MSPEQLDGVAEEMAPLALSGCWGLPGAPAEVKPEQRG